MIMLSSFINTTFTIVIKGKEYLLNKCKVRDIPKMTAFGDMVKDQDTVMQLKIYFDYICIFLSDKKKKKEFLKSIYSLDIDEDLDKLVTSINKGIYGEQKGSEGGNGGEKSIIKSMLFVKKYYGLSVEEMENLTLEQFGYYSEMILAIEDPKEYAKKEIQDKAMNGGMTLDDIKNFILKK